MGLGPVEHLEPRTQITIRPFSWVPIYTQHLFCYLLWLLSKLKKITYAFSTLSRFTWSQFWPPREKLPSFSWFQIQGIKEGLLFAQCREGIQFWISLWLGGVTVHRHRWRHVRLWEECGGWQCWEGCKTGCKSLRWWSSQRWILLPDCPSPGREKQFPSLSQLWEWQRQNQAFPAGVMFLCFSMKVLGQSSSPAGWWR